MPNNPRRYDRAGYSVPAFAEVTGLSIEQVRRAVQDGQITVVEFAGLHRIPTHEAPRIANLLGLELREPPKPRGHPRKQRLDAAE